MNNPVLEVLRKRKCGIRCGIPSFCCANKIVIEAALDQAQRFDDTVLIEATSNQVNQERGYTGMTPQDFHDFVFGIADNIGFDRKKIIIGGDHMGPLPWYTLPADQAMENAIELVKLCVRAEYQKIHLDTSMRLGDDPIDKPLETRVIAMRGAILYKACEDEFEKLKNERTDAVHPVFVIGSEVPVPGGIQDAGAKCEVTDSKDFEETLLTYREVFSEMGLDDAWNYIVAVVVQPGVEFGNNEIKIYDRVAAHALCDTLRKYPDIVFEGHSTDYQPPAKLKEMVEDGIAIIKVGPALTFALRDALYALSSIEAIVIQDPAERANFPSVLEEEMKQHPQQWSKYYFGTELDKKIDRSFSLSDRCRYYLATETVNAAIEKLFKNIDSINIPLGLLHQYMPLQYMKVINGILSVNAKELVKDSVVTIIDDYNFAVKHNYMTSSIFAR